MYTENSFIGSGLNIQLPLACSFTIEKIYNGLMLPIFRDSKTIVVHFEPYKNNFFVVAGSRQKKNFRASKFKRNSIQKDIFSVGRERIITLTRKNFFLFLLAASWELDFFQVVRGEAMIARFLARCLEESTDIKIYEKLAPGSSLLCKGAFRWMASFGAK